LGQILRPIPFLYYEALIPRSVLKVDSFHYPANQAGLHFAQIVYLNCKLLVGVAQEYQENCHQIFCTNVLFIFLYLKRNALFCLRLPTNDWNPLALNYTKGLQSHIAEIHENKSKTYNNAF
jgi:hypothetical protein